MFTILKTIQTKLVIGYSYCSKKDFKKGGEVGNDHLEKTSVGKPEVGPLNALSIQRYPDWEPQLCSLMASIPRIKVYRKFDLILSMLFLFWHNSLFDQIDLNDFFSDI